MNEAKVLADRQEMQSDSQAIFLNTAEEFIELVERTQKTRKIPLTVRLFLWLMKWKLRSFRRF